MVLALTAVIGCEGSDPLLDVVSRAIPVCHKNYVGSCIVENTSEFLKKPVEWPISGAVKTVVWSHRLRQKGRTSWLLDGRTLTSICLPSLSGQGVGSVTPGRCPVIEPRPLNETAPSSRRVCGKVPVEVDHKFLAILVLLAYRLSEPGETPGSTLPANRSQ
jgi:hypothetical protein